MTTNTPILVTGGTGFLGRHIVWRFAQKGHPVIFTGRNQKAAEEVLHHSSGSVRFLRLDHGSSEALATLQSAASDVAAIVHCAALSAPWGKKNDFISANVKSTAEVLAACKHHNIPKLVHISTPSLYFGYKDALGISEESALPTPVNHYAATKRAAEDLVCSSGLDACVILRPRALFGPWDNTLLPRLLRAMKKGCVPLPRKGQALVDLTYVDNAVDAVELALTRNLLKPISIYNVSNGTPVRLIDLLEIVSRNFNIPLRTLNIPPKALHAIAYSLELLSHLKVGQPEPLITRYSAGVLAFHQTLDLTAIQRDLGYKPRIHIEEGIRRQALWYQEMNK